MYNSLITLFQFSSLGGSQETTWEKPKFPGPKMFRKVGLRVPEIGQREILLWQ